MQSDNPLEAVASIEAAIDYQPLIVTSDLPVRTVMQRMSDRVNITATKNINQVVVSSCALVQENHKLVGIFTESDIVRLAASEKKIDELLVGDVMSAKVISLPANSFQDVFGALFLFRRYQVRHLPILSDRDEVVGVISSESLRRIIRPVDFLKLRRVGEVMSTPVVCAPLNTSLLRVAQLMTQQKVSCVVIVEIREAYGNDVYEFPIGIITERDMVQYQSCYVDFANTTAELVMSTPLFLLSPEDSLWTAHQEMQRLRVRRLVVSWDWGKGLGIITLTNLLRLLDPLEMRRTKEVVTQAVVEQSPQSRLPLLAQQEQEYSQIKQKLRQLAAEIHTHLVNTTGDRNFVNRANNSELANALTKLKRLQALIENFDPPDKPFSRSEVEPISELNDCENNLHTTEINPQIIDDESPQTIAGRSLTA